LIGFQALIEFHQALTEILNSSREMQAVPELFEFWHVGDDVAFFAGNDEGK